MLVDVDVVWNDNAKLLLIDTCAEAAGVALSAGSQVVEREVLTPRSASAEIVAAVRLLLARAGWALANLDGVGVVNGPGSFTGVRAGLAAAKGLCEATGLRLAAVSRLEVLAEAGVSDDTRGDVCGSEPGARGPELVALRPGLAALGPGLAALDAGRGELYVREQRAGLEAREWVCRFDELRAIAQGRRVTIAEERLAEQLAGCAVTLRSLNVGDALRPVLRRMREIGSDVATVDANYVRGEADIYRRNTGEQTPATDSVAAGR